MDINKRNNTMTTSQRLTAGLCSSESGCEDTIKTSFNVKDWENAGSLNDLKHYFTTMKTGMPNGANEIDFIQMLPLSIPHKIHIVGVVEPACIFVQTQSQLNLITTLQNDLKLHCNTPLQPKDISVGLYVAVNYQDNFYRGQIESFSEKEQKYWVRLVDTGLRIYANDMQQLFSLPASMLKINRQVVPVAVTTIKPRPIQGEDWTKRGIDYLQKLLMGSQNYRLCNLQFKELQEQPPYFGALELVEKYTLPEEEWRLPSRSHAKNKNSVSGNFFPRYNHKELDVDAKIDVEIVHIKSPAKFLVRELSEEARREKEEMDMRVVGTGPFSTMYYEGQRCCVAPSTPSQISSGIKGFRAFCQEIDFTVEPTKATVVLMDYGVTKEIPLSELMGYTDELANKEALTYRCIISVEPANGEWSSETVESMKQLMEYNGEGGKVEVKCVSTKPRTKRRLRWKRYVEVKLDCCNLDWGQALLDIGEAKMHPYSKDKRDLEGSKLEIARDSDEFQRFQEIGNDMIGNYTIWNDYSWISYICIPAVILPSLGEPLKLKRFDGLHLHLYVFTTQNYEEKYKELQKDFKKLLAQGKAEPRGYTFIEGDIAFAPWGDGQYERCCVTEFRKRNDGKMYATVTAFDIEEKKCLPVTELKLPAGSAMNVEKLSHVIWLEGMDEKMQMWSQDFTTYIQPLLERATWNCSESVVLKPNWRNMVVRVSLLDETGKQMWLAEQIKKHCIWTWERYFDAGFLSESRLLKKMSEIIPMDQAVQTFIEKGIGIDIKHRNTTPFWVCGIAPHPSISHILNIDGILLNPSIKNDGGVLFSQLQSYYNKVLHQEEVEDFSILPKPSVVAIRETAAQRELDLYACQWHRCLFKTEDQPLVCADCFQQFKLDETRKPSGFQVRKLCSDMLKVPPLGKRLSFKLPTNAAAKLAVDLIQPANVIGVHLESPTSQLLTDNHFQSRTRIPVNVPKIMKRVVC